MKRMTWLAACIFFTVPAFADAILTSDNRFTSTSGSGHVCSFSCVAGNQAFYNPSWSMSASPSAPFADFSVIETPNTGGLDTSIRVSQTSSVSPTDFEASGIVWVNSHAFCGSGYSSGGCTVGGNAASVFEVGFTLSDAEPYQFTVGFHFGLPGTIYLSGTGIQTLTAGNNGFSSSGVLPAGSYVLHADQIASFSMAQGESFVTDQAPSDLDYYRVSLVLQSQSTPAPVPEAGSFLALVAGLAMLGIFIRLC